MKRLLICVLAIAMMLSSVAFANESVRINVTSEYAISTNGDITMSQKENDVVKGLEVQGSLNGGKASKFEITSDPKDKYGDVLKLTNPALKETGAVFAYINANFQDPIPDTTRKGITKNFNFGFSMYPVDNNENAAEFELVISAKYCTPGGTTTETQLLCRINNESILDNSKAISMPFIGDWYDLRFNVDVETSVAKVYVNDIYFCKIKFDKEIDYIRYFNLNTTVSTVGTAEKIAYFDNFFVNETPELLFEESIKEINYGTCYIDDDFSNNAEVKINNPNQGNNGSVVEQLRDNEEILKVTIAKGATNLPSFGSKAVSGKEGAANHVPYNNEEYIFEMDVNFEDFNSATTKLTYVKYNLEGMTNDPTTNSCMIIEEGGAFKVGTDSDNMKSITVLEKNKWYNFKFHYKPYKVVDGKNNGLMVDIYFMNNLVGENLIISQTSDKHIATFRNVNVQSGSAPTDKDRVVKYDNLKFYQVNGIEFLPKVVDVEVSNASGDLISTSYDAGEKTITAYVTSKSAQEAGSLTLVVARYSTDGQLIDVKPVSAAAIEKDKLVKVEAKLDVANISANECIKVMIVDSLGNLTPYTKPIILSSSVQ